MARTTDADVKKVIALNVLTDTTPFINTANLMVTQHLSNSGLSSEILAEIEKYLAAHLVALHPDERQVTREKLGEAENTYAGVFGKGLEATQYGQTVMMLDTTGSLSALGGTYCSLEVVSIPCE